MTRGWIVGAGAQGRVIAEMWRAQHPGAALGFLDDDPALHGQRVLGLLVAGPVERLADQHGRDAEVMLGIGHNARRLSLADRWDAHGIAWGRVVHPSAVVAPSAEIGAGTVVFAQAAVNAGARLGRHVVVNTSVVVEHDCVIGDGAYLAPGACMGGRVEIGRGAFLAVGATLAPRVSVGAGAVIGAGAVVMEDIPAAVLAYGAPARVVQALDASFDWSRLL